VESSERIISQQLKDHHSDLALDLLSIFLSLEKQCYFENFEEVKMRNLVLICSIYPKECAQYLGNEFNTEISKYSMGKRIMMLEVLVETAKKLSAIEIERKESKKDPENVLNKLNRKFVEDSIDQRKIEAEKIIRERLLKKTRRIVSQSKSLADVSAVNRFADVAGYFFFPLIHGFGKKQFLFTTKTSLKYDTDNILLMTFLRTISVLMLCAENCPVAPKFAREIFNLSVFLRFHDEAKIRLGVFHMLSTLFLALPKNLLQSMFYNDIQELRAHLEIIVNNVVLNKEPNQECKEFAGKLLEMCYGCLILDEP
jgi:telomere length regulation protein